VDAALIASATLLGLAGAPHCAAMCAAPCAAAVGRGGAQAGLAFQAGRLLSYAAVGALAASSVAALAAWSQWSPALRPLWALLHAGALALGLWLLWRGRQPAWMAQLGRVPRVAGPGVPAGWQRVNGPLRAGGAGLLWAAWPCGLLQSALLVAAMANGAAGGALAMGGFALASAPGLVLAPWMGRRLLGGADAAARERLAVRAAGGLLALASAWALGHGVWAQVAAFCATL
jgi:sulfite exporter TauE/SafE